MRRPLAVLFALLAPAGLQAQGTVSAQGLGYPPGQLSTSALSTGGAFAGFDPATPRNPGSLGLVGSTVIFAHYAPESRSVSVGDGSDDARVERFPLLGAILPIGGGRGSVGIAASTLLDRSWTTSRSTSSGPGAPVVVESFQSRGSITDVRAAIGWRFSDQFQAGAGVHALTGSNRITLTRVDPSEGGLTFEQVDELGFSGTALSAGAVWAPSRLLAVEASGQLGGTLRARQAGETVASAKAPALAGGSVRYTGITGAALAARAEWQRWSDVDPLGSAQFDARDTWSYGVGADIEGPRLFGTSLGLRVGAQWRDLPFVVLGEQPTERSVSGGIGLPLARGRVMLDLGVQRATREAGEATETGWTFGAGLSVRP